MTQLKFSDISVEKFKGLEVLDDTTALQRLVLQTELWHYTISFQTPGTYFNLKNAPC